MPLDLITKASRHQVLHHLAHRRPILNVPAPRPVSELRPLPAECRDLDGLAAYLQTARAHIREQALHGAHGIALAQLYSDYVDAVIGRMFSMACAVSGVSETDPVPPLAIVATGGYGRREMCLHSDIDITFIPAHDGDQYVDPIVKAMFASVMRVLMDAVGVEVGYAYRLIGDCGSLDHQTLCGLLDGRLVAGNPRVFLQFEHEFWPNVNPAEFIFAKLDERRQQRQASGGTPRIVEPNIKTGPGGMRDLQAAIWLVQARESLPAADVRGDRCWDVLERRAGIAAEDTALLRDAKEFLFRTRNALHAVVGQERDQLVVTRQEEIALALGYDDVEGAPPGVERFMRDVYSQLVTINRLCDEIAQRIENSRLFMGIGLDCVNRQLTPVQMLLEAEDPVWMVHAGEMAQRFDLEFSPDLRHTIIALLARSPRTAEPARLAETITTILSSRKPIYPILQRLADLGILGWAFPDVGRTMDLIPYDASHDYTVGQHTLFVIRNLDNLRSPAASEDLREFQLMMAELAAPEQLYLAALLHDAGKAVPERPHWETGKEIAERVCTALGWKPEATANVVFLVQHHLLMAETSRLRDLGLDETIREFTSIVDDHERLRMLYLLTYADTRAVGEGLWTQVKARYLSELYSKAERALSTGMEEGFDDAALMRTRRRLAKELAVDNLPTEEVTAHLEGLPAQYVLNTSMEEIALHVGFVRQARSGTPTVSFHDDRFATFTEVTVCTLDDPRPGLLAKIAGVLLAADLNVHSAQVFTRIAADERVAIDTLCVDFRGRQLTKGKRREVASNLTDVLTGVTTVEAVLARRGRAVDGDRPLERLAVRNDVSPRYTVIEVASPEPKSTLYRVSRAISALGWDIHSARLSMFRGRSMATFYVSGARDIGERAAREVLAQHLPVAAQAPSARTLTRSPSKR
jgi:[protein-PII] uridylyltransferase